MTNRDMLLAQFCALAQARWQDDDLPGWLAALSAEEWQAVAYELMALAQWQMVTAAWERDRPRLERAASVRLLLLTEARRRGDLGHLSVS